MYICWGWYAVGIGNCEGRSRKEPSAERAKRKHGERGMRRPSGSRFHTRRGYLRKTVPPRAAPGISAGFVDCLRRKHRLKSVPPTEAIASRLSRSRPGCPSEEGLDTPDEDVPSVTKAEPDAAWGSQRPLTADGSEQARSPAVTAKSGCLQLQGQASRGTQPLHPHGRSVDPSSDAPNPRSRTHPANSL